jgi:hypothetical protein
VERRRRWLRSLRYLDLAVRLLHRASNLFPAPLLRPLPLTVYGARSYFRSSEVTRARLNAVPLTDVGERFRLQSASRCTKAHPPNQARQGKSLAQASGFGD